MLASRARRSGMGAADTRPELVERDELRSVRAVASLQRRLERLPDSHPASPRYVRETPAPAEPDARPLTDAEHADHVTQIHGRLADAHKAGLATDRQHTLDGWGEVWSDERQAIHDDIVQDLYARAADVPCDGKAILAGGLPGSGKTTVLNEHAGIDLSRYLMINPDQVKEEMAKRGLVPEVGGLTPMEASELAHEESSYIAKRLANRAESDRRNVIWDITMSRSATTLDRVTSLRSAGYSSVDAIFVDIPIDVSVRRADGRHREGHDEFLAGRGLGGRFISEETIRSYSDRDWGSQNRRNFEEIKSSFDSAYRFDNSADGRAPVLVEVLDSGRRDNRSELR
jgi:hypothetical protein